ncbi:hypothetical protein Scep_027476 [Stephania cephalantha]|uniref:Uncharacterized protein n=1 Tax=Stephania cephalantha TaxID=152367 RepID=A0AAP0HIJ4_9MAGN
MRRKRAERRSADGVGVRQRTSRGRRERAAAREGKRARRRSDRGVEASACDVEEERGDESRTTTTMADDGDGGGDDGATAVKEVSGGLRRERTGRMGFRSVDLLRLSFQLVTDMKSDLSQIEVDLEMIQNMVFGLVRFCSSSSGTRGSAIVPLPIADGESNFTNLSSKNALSSNIQRGISSDHVASAPPEDLIPRSEVCLNQDTVGHLIFEISLIACLDSLSSL